MTDEKEEAPDSPDVHFEPVVRLAPVDVVTHEEEEEDFLKMRAKLFRYDSSAEPPEWKERGTGDMKILKHKETGVHRILMRRDKTLKVCANHAILSHMELKPNCGSDRAWVWSTPADFADDESKPELLALRFANAENAQKFKEKFDCAKSANQELADKEAANETSEQAAGDAASGDAASGDEAETADSKKSEAADNVADKLGGLSVAEPAAADPPESTDDHSSDDKDQAER